MEIAALGPLVVRSDQGQTRLRPAQLRLLASLLLEPDRAIPTDRLMDRMWGESPPATARNTLHAHMSSLRRALPGLIESSKNRYSLGLAGHVFDVAAFTDLVADADRSLSRGRPSDALANAERALGLWRGDPFSELPDADTAVAERARLTELRLGAVATLADSLRRLDRPAEAIAMLEALIVQYPLNEALREQLARCLYQAGRPADSLRALGDIRRTLTVQLGVDPGPRLSLLEDKILTHHPELAPRSAATRKHRLPDYRTSFVGREGEMVRVTDLVRRHRLVTISGGPGFGKTRLGIEVGKALREHFDNEVILIRLVEAVSEADVLATIANALGLVDSVTDLDELQHYLAGRHTLLILDNCEHLLEPVRRFVGGAGLAGSLHVLATSRKPLRVSGERVWRLAPLSLPDGDDAAYQSAAVKLLVDRVAAAHGEAMIHSADTAHLVALCRRTGGIPLVLELAARWVPRVGLRESVDLAFEPIPEGATPFTPHHQSLTRAIDWSVGALSTPDSDAFVAASTFKGTFTLEAFWQVCVPGRGRSEAAAAVSRLVDASLLTVETNGDDVRYRMLEPLREHASRHLTDASTRQIAERHAAWFVQRTAAVSRMTDGPRDLRLSEIDEELGDIRAAMRHLLDLGRPDDVASIATSLKWYWFARYLSTEAQRWLSAALLGDLKPETRIGALSAAGWAAYVSADYAQGDSYYEECLALARERGDRLREGEALYGLARIHLPRRIRDGGVLLEEALSIFEEVDAELAAAECRLWLGLSSANLGEVASARRWLDQAIDVLESSGHLGYVAVGHRYLSLAAWHSEDEQLARRHVDLAEAMARAGDDHRALCGAYIQRALVEGKWGELSHAARAILDALAPIPENNDIDFCMISFGAFPLLIRAERWEVAARLLSHLDRIYDAYGWTPLDQRIPVTADFRADIAGALEARGIRGEFPRVSSAVMAAALIDELETFAGPVGTIRGGPPLDTSFQDGCREERDVEVVEGYQL